MRGVRPLLLIGVLAWGQTPPKKLEFDVASVKVVREPSRTLRGMSGGPGSNDPKRFRCSSCTLQALLVWAYQLPLDRISGPSWWTTDHYDIDAKVPEETTQQQFQQMYRNLLLDRFRMAVHFERRDFMAYEMTVAKGGLKMKEFAADPNAPPDLPRDRPSLAPLSFKDGFPVLEPGNGSRSWGIRYKGRSLLTARRQGMGQIAEYVLQNALRVESGQPVRVIDKTGLTGEYNFQFQYALPDQNTTDQNLPPGADYLDSLGEPAPDVITAAREQLGLLLIKSRITLDVLVVDHAERVPTEN